MKILNKSVVLIAMTVAALALASAPRAAAQSGSVSGQILDINAKPWAGLTVQATSEQGAKQTAKTDNDGKYTIGGLRPGVYMVTISAFPPPNDKQQPYDLAKVRVEGGGEAKADANFKDILAKQPAAQEQVKKQTEEKERIEGLKGHVSAPLLPKKGKPRRISKRRQQTSAMRQSRSLWTCPIKPLQSFKRRRRL